MDAAQIHMKPTGLGQRAEVGGGPESRMTSKRVDDHPNKKNNSHQIGNCGQPWSKSKRVPLSRNENRFSSPLSCSWALRHSCGDWCNLVTTSTMLITCFSSALAQFFWGPSLAVGLLVLTGMLNVHRSCPVARFGSTLGVSTRFQQQTSQCS